MLANSMASWLLTGHLIGLFLWLGGMFAVYWMLRLHAQAPKDVHDKLVLMERSLAMVMDLGATLAIVCGLGMAFSARADYRGTHVTSNLFAAAHAGWFHIKLAVVVLGVLSCHGIIRARVARFARGQSPTVPQWIWSLLLVSIVVIIILVFRGPAMFAPSTP